MKMLWQVAMRNKAGYNCITVVSPENASSEEHAMRTAGSMFPEMEILWAVWVVCADEVRPNELSG